MANEVFISYSRKDYKKVKNIKAELDKKFGLNCWMDLDGIESDKQFVDIIINAINRHENVLFMMSKNSMGSDWALKELRFAESKQKRIVLVHIDDSIMNDAFLFYYGGKDLIDWNNQIQHDKLLQDIGNWTGKLQNQEKKSIKDETVEDAKDSSTDYSLGKEKRGKIMGLVLTACLLIALIFSLVNHVSKTAEQDDVYTPETYQDNEQKYEDPEQELQRAAERGDADAQYELGLKYYPTEEAVKWFRKAAYQGHAEAQNKLGWMYEFGYGVEPDYNEAERWLRKAANQGVSEAQKYFE